MAEFAYKIHQDEEGLVELNQGATPNKASQIWQKYSKFLIACALILVILIVALALGLALSNRNKELLSAASHSFISQGNTLKNCSEAPPLLDNGRISNQSQTSPYRVNDLVTYECNSGYQLSGSNTTICTYNDTWIWSSSTKPSCIATCVNPPPIENGRLVNANPKKLYLEGDRVLYTCNDGFDLYSYDNFITCNSSAPWRWLNLTLPVCKRNCSEAPPLLDNGRISNQSQTSPYRVNDLVTYECNSGYQLSGSNTTICTYNDTWIWSSSTKPSCIATCVNPPPIENGRLVNANPKKLYLEGDRVLYTCNDGFDLYSYDNFITCNSSAPWRWLNLTLPVCKRICSSPPSIANARIANTTRVIPLLEGDRVVYECLSGYSLTSSNSAICHSSSVWIWNKVTFPVCKKICIAPPLLGNGSITNPQQQYLEKYRIVYSCNYSFNLTGSNMAFCQSDGTWLMSQGSPPACLKVNNTRPISCKQIRANGFTSSGIYTIYPFGKSGIQIYCDQETDGGGWEVFQRRIDGTLDFFRNWTSYVNGFGNISAEFWLGLEYIHAISSASTHEMRVDLEDFENFTAFANYRNFEIGPAATNYSLNINGYFGNAGDGFARLNGYAFSTLDRDNDGSRSTNCATRFRGAWWYRQCYARSSHLNGEYFGGPHRMLGGIAWIPWRSRYSLKFVEMKMRPISS